MASDFTLKDFRLFLKSHPPFTEDCHQINCLPRSTQVLGLPELANKNIGYPVTIEFKINDENFSINMFHACTKIKFNWVSACYRHSSPGVQDLRKRSCGNGFVWWCHPRTTTQLLKTMTLRFCFIFYFLFLRFHFKQRDHFILLSDFITWWPRKAHRRQQATKSLWVLLVCVVCYTLTISSISKYSSL